MATIRNAVSLFAVAVSLSCVGHAPSAAQPTAGGLPAWTGSYIGGHVGGAAVRWRSDVTFTATDPRTGDQNIATFSGPSGTGSGFVGGGQIGYNWQAGAYI